LGKWGTHRYNALKRKGGTCKKKRKKKGISKIIEKNMQRVWVEKENKRDSLER